MHNVSFMDFISCLPGIGIPALAGKMLMIEGGTSEILSKDPKSLDNPPESRKELLHLYSKANSCGLIQGILTAITGIALTILGIIPLGVGIGAVVAGGAMIAISLYSSHKVNKFILTELDPEIQKLADEKLNPTSQTTINQSELQKLKEENSKLLKQNKSLKIQLNDETLKNIASREIIIKDYREMHKSDDTKSQLLEQMKWEQRALSLQRLGILEEQEELKKLTERSN